jgi:Flp pilus assembly protein TadB
MRLLAGLAAAFATFVVLSHPGSAAHRLPTTATSQVEVATAERRRLRGLISLAVVGALLLVGLVGVVGVVVAGVAGVLTIGLRLRRPSQPAVDSALTIDLLAGCLAAGAPMSRAIVAAAGASPESLRTPLAAVARSLETGAPPVAAWKAVGDVCPAMTKVARVCTRGMGSGSSIAAELSGIAARERRHRRTSRQQRINRASVWAVLPLGLCFLPAFILVGVVPIVIGLLTMSR